MQKRLEQIKQELFHSEDLKVRPFMLDGETANLIYIETLCDAAKLETSVFKQWFLARSRAEREFNIDDLLTAASVQKINDVQDAVKSLLQGKGLIGFVNSEELYAFNAEQSNVRSIQEPVNERSIVGERAGFVEHLSVNLNLIRNRASSSFVKVRYLTVGKHKSHKVAIIWLEGVAEESVVHETIERLSDFQSSMEVHPGKLQRQLVARRSIFPLVYSTERVDTTSTLLMQGRVAILTDQSSTCLIVPASFYTFMRTIDSLLLGPQISQLLHFLRMIGLMLSLYACSLYIATTMFHHEVLPAKMTINIKSSLENVPYPPIIEAIIMIIVFQLIAEATIRLPSQLAQMVGVAGGIIISESLVKVGFVSNVFIVIIAISMIGSFIIPTYQMRIFALMVQLMLLLGASLLGFYGIVFVTAGVLIHFFTLEPFGIPYCLPIRSNAK
ncbi:hypothetical protein SY83_17175 [Paenibacillus swuensis]|uniref:Uncharacterized protein n=1 Tax=Paenibacillus swuensis TaxID=1178515 RepID=A0A172TLN2_9BACL|nr:spore germination protein [Paenibacillus swuensis]ANE47727.1 hypothetical protein SY83_17175 [Paenibacillus swuensis]